MSRGRSCRWATLAVLLSVTGGCSCNAGIPDPGAAGTTAGGAGMGEHDPNAGAGGNSGAMAETDGMRPGPDDGVVDAAPEGPRHFRPTNGFEAPEHGVAWELDGEGTFVAIWHQDPSSGPFTIQSGLARIPWDDELGGSWYCIGEGSTFSTREGSGKNGEGALRNLTRLPECTAGSDTIAIDESGLRFAMKSSIPELIVDTAQPLGARCIEQTCDIYFSTLNEEGEVGFVIMQLVTKTPVGMTPFNPTAMPTEIESAYLALIRDDGTALLACAGGGTMNRLAMGDAIFSLTQVGRPVTCPGGAMGPSSLDFTTDSRASSQ